MLYPELRKRVQEEFTSIYGDPDEFSSGKKVDLVLIEDKSAGISLLQDLRQTMIPVTGYNPGNADKTTRLNIVAPMIEKGLVYLPESNERHKQPMTWLDPFLREISSFPMAKHDDYVDALSQALRYLRDSGIITLDHHPAPDDDYADDRRVYVNPYAL
jgi:predicted phage terminase large subunit-like protein